MQGTSGALDGAGQHDVHAELASGLERGRVSLDVGQTHHAQRTDLRQLRLELIGDPFRQVHLA